MNETDKVCPQKAVTDDGDSLTQALAILKDLEQSIEERRKVWQSLRKSNPHFEQLSEENWGNTKARSWLHGATEVPECNELEKWLYSKTEPSKLAHSKAHPLISDWKSENDNKKPFGSYYCDDPQFTLVSEPNETLKGFIERMAEDIEKNALHSYPHTLWRSKNLHLITHGQIPPSALSCSLQNT